MVVLRALQGYSQSCLPSLEHLEEPVRQEQAGQAQDKRAEGGHAGRPSSSHAALLLLLHKYCSNIYNVAQRTTALVSPFWTSPQRPISRSCRTPWRPHPPRNPRAPTCGRGVVLVRLRSGL